MRAKPNGQREPAKPKREKSPAAPASSAKPEPKRERDEALAKVIEEARWLHQHGDEYRAKLLQNIKAHLPQLEELMGQAEDHWGMEDSVYRFYHGSFKVYYVQRWTEETVKTLQALLENRPLNTWFCKLVGEGTGKKFEESSNENWFQETRAILEAAFHAHYFLKMACKYGKQLETPPDAMPSGWALVLYLFNLR